MHRVIRGSEPPGLPQVRARYTTAWVAHYRDRTRAKPTDKRWIDFRGDIEIFFFGLCGYCEEIVIRGEVDHFRPKSKFPERVYQWPN